MPKSKNNQLKKSLGLSFGIAILIGGTIGVGILRTPGVIASMLDNYWLIIICWLLGGLYILIGANSYAELATMLPKAGGSYNYIKRAFGDYAGFLSGWFDYIANAVPPAFYCIVISEYIVILFPDLESQSTVIAISFLAAFTLLHVSGVKNGSFIQQLTSIIKVLFFVALIVACFIHSGLKFYPIEKDTSFFEMGIVFGFFKSLQLIIGTYDGWYAVCFFAEEDENPSKNIPKSLYTGAIIVIVIYVLINIAFFQVLPVSALANSPLVASDVAKVVFGNKGSIIVTIIAIFSLISILNAYMMIPARILFGLSRDRFFIQHGSRINKGGTPIVALLISSLFSLFLISIGSFEILFSFGTFMTVIVWGLAYCSLIKLRTKEPNLPRPYLSWGYPWTSILMILATLTLLTGFAYSDTKNFVIIIIITIISYPTYLIIDRRNKKK
ncbi:APC family permease [Flavobacterium sp. 83]|jgi:APA family basic amino acid/polyamine antiporter|uniref:APC family permease n=1 Tax=Flavobacterium sp. 83 TaxID=1131812 RepID=UPI0005570B98|nr:APC family permease [Flavobacterium sp. 83]